MEPRFFAFPARATFAGAAFGAALLAAGPARADIVAKPQPNTVTQTANYPGEAFAFLNTNAAGGGLVGQVGPSVFANTHAGLAGIYNAAGTTIGSGVFGLSTTGYGVYGRSASRYAAIFGAAVYNAVVGESSGGIGVLGQTSAPNNVQYAKIFPFDSQTYAGRAGIFGNDASAPAVDSQHVNENAGVVGISKAGLAGVVGVLAGASPYGSTAGVLGTNFAANEEGVFGYDDSSSANSSGLFGSSLYGTGTTTFSSAGEGLNVYSGANVALEADNATLNSVPALLVQGANESSSVPVVIVRNNYGGSGPANDIFSIGSDGTVIASGSITGSSSPLAVTRGAGGARYVAYGARTSSPTIEDVGFGTLENGYAAVRLDPAFASTVDPRAPYAVFLSPEGDNNGLYVTAKTAGSFVVREARGGRSTLPFSYRIVARPLDMPLARRLPDARTALVRPVFDDTKVRAMDLERKAARARFARTFGQTN